MIYFEKIVKEFYVEIRLPNVPASHERINAETHKPTDTIERPRTHMTQHMCPGTHTRDRGVHAYTHKDTGIEGHEKGKYARMHRKWSNTYTRVCILARSPTPRTFLHTFIPDSAFCSRPIQGKLWLVLYYHLVNCTANYTAQEGRWDWIFLRDVNIPVKRNAERSNCQLSHLFISNVWILQIMERVCSVEIKKSSVFDYCTHCQRRFLFSNNGANPKKKETRCKINETVSYIMNSTIDRTRYLSGESVRSFNGALSNCTKYNFYLFRGECGQYVWSFCTILFTFLKCIFS